MRSRCVALRIKYAWAVVALALMIAALNGAAAIPAGAGTQDGEPAPSPELTASDVVRIQVEALRGNTPSNKGIEITYRFASPGNKEYTGPLTRFIDMVSAAPYDRLLNHRSAEYSPMAVDGDQARQVVMVIDAAGEETAYIWVLSRQTDGSFKDCWMTDAVIPAEPSAPRKLT